MLSSKRKMCDDKRLKPLSVLRGPSKIGATEKLKLKCKGGKESLTAMRRLRVRELLRRRREDGNRKRRLLPEREPLRRKPKDGNGKRKRNGKRLFSARILPLCSIQQI